MARLESQMSFTEEVDFNEIEFEKVVGKGAFGVVSKATWRETNVAVKMIESEEEIKAFRVEVRQLSRVDHPNIVKLYGASTTHPVCLVMEYAEGGSLYNVLHGSAPQPIYKAAHAMSWALQCARGVDYLHGMTPKKLIHRDLKPANLLLMSGGTVLKICDFGTACDFQTYMTNNKGSAAWMAPEVFEGSLYSEKCDVFSWGVILWEVISRRKPFDDIGGPAFRIMWAVHNGRRPPLIRNIPKPLEKIMTRCWAKDPKQRPSMHEVVSIMSNLMQFFKGADQPLVYPQVTKDEDGVNSGMINRLVDQTAEMSMTGNSLDSRGSTISDTVIYSTSSHSNGPQEQPKVETPLVFNELMEKQTLNVSKDQKKRHSMDLLDLRGDEDNSAKPAVQTHRRCNSQGQMIDHTFPANVPPLPTKPDISASPPQAVLTPATPSPSSKTPTPIPISPQSTPSTPNAMPSHHTRPTSPSGHLPPQSISVPSNLSMLDHPRQRPYSQGDFQSPLGNTPGSSSKAHHRHSASELRGDNLLLLPQHSHSHAVLESRMGVGGPSGSTSATSGPGRFDRSQSLDQRFSTSKAKNEDTISMAYSTLEPHLQPLPPNPKSKESQDIFDEHMRMAQEYLRVQTELALLYKRKKELAEALDQDWKDKQANFRLIEEFNTLQGEKESLLELHKRQRSQLDMFRLQIQRQQQQQHMATRRM